MSKEVSVVMLGQARWPSAAAKARMRAALARRPRGLLTDIDGTLSPIAPSPDLARLLPGVRTILREALGVFDVVAAVSGRDPRDALRLVGLPALTYLGSHGLERLEPVFANPTAGDFTGDDSTGANSSDTASQSASPADAMRSVVFPAAAPYRGAIAAALAEVGATLAARFPGVQLEDKGVTASVHVRQTADPAVAEEAAFAAASEVAARVGLRVTRGKLVVELRPPVAMDKGLAIADLIVGRGLRSALYLGDDQTDLDAFRMLRRLSAEGVRDEGFVGVSVAILSSEAPSTLADEADVTLDAITRVPALLRWLVATAAKA